MPEAAELIERVFIGWTEDLVGSLQVAFRCGRSSNDDVPKLLAQTAGCGQENPCGALGSRKPERHAAERVKVRQYAQ